MLLLFADNKPEIQEEEIEPLGKITDPPETLKPLVKRAKLLNVGDALIVNE